MALDSGGVARDRTRGRGRLLLRRQGRRGRLAADGRVVPDDPGPGGPPVRRGAAGRRASARPSCGPGSSSCALTLAPESIAGYVRGLKAFGNWCVAEELAARARLPGAAPAARAAPAHRPVQRRGAAEPARPRRSDASGRSCSSCSTRGSGSPRSTRCGSATSDPTGRSTSWARAPRSGSCRSARPPAGPSSATSRTRTPVGPPIPLFCGRYGAPLSTARHPLRDRAARAAGGRRHPLQPPHVPPHVRPRLPRQRRRRVQPPADPRPHDARHGPPLREPVRGRPRRAPSDGVAGRSPND